MKYLIIALLIISTVASKAQHSDTVANSHWAQGAWTYKRNATDTIGVVLYMQHFYVQQPVDSEPYPDIYGASTFFSDNDFIHPDKWDTPIRFFMKGNAGDAKEVVLLACNDFGGTATITVTYLADNKIRVKTYLSRCEYKHLEFKPRRYN